MAQLKDLIVSGNGRIIGDLYGTKFVGPLQGNASTATSLTTNAGTSAQPIYFSGGKPVACGFTIGTSVPAGAKFTDTVYTHPTSSGNKHIPSGGSAGQILRWSADGTAVWGNDNNTTYSAFKAATASAAGGQGLVPAPAAGAQTKYLRADGTWQYPPNTTYGTGNTTTLGLTKLYTGTGSATDGTMTQKAITDALNSKAPSSHTHTKSQITDFPTALKNPAALTINGTVYDGSTAKTVNISTAWNSISGRPDLLNCMRMYGGAALDSKGTTADSSAQYNTISISTATVNTVAFNKVLTDLPKGKYSVMIRLKISANSSSGNILKMECGDTSALKTFYIKPNMFTAANKYQTFGFTIDLTTTSFTSKLSIGTALSGVTANIDYIAIAPAFTAITSIA